MEQKLEKWFCVFQIYVFALGVAKSLNLEHDTCHRQSVCEKTLLRIHVQLGEIFSKSTSLRMMKRHDKSALMVVLQVFVTFSHVNCQSAF